MGKEESESMYIAIIIIVCSFIGASIIWILFHSLLATIITFSLSIFFGLTASIYLIEVNDENY